MRDVTKCIVCQDVDCQSKLACSCGAKAHVQCTSGGKRLRRSMHKHIKNWKCATCTELNVSPAETCGCVCAKCDVVVTPPVMQCTSGHIMCKDCTWTHGKCAVCDESTEDFGRNRLLETVQARKFCRCPNAASGCTFSSTYKDIVKHAETCSYNPYKCPLCCKSVPYDVFQHHLEDVHEIGKEYIIMENNPGTLLEIPFNELMDSTIVQEFTCNSQQFVVIAKAVRFLPHMDPDISCIAYSKDQLVDCKMKMWFGEDNGPQLAFSYSPKQIGSTKSEELGLQFPLYYYSSICDKDTLRVHFITE